MTDKEIKKLNKQINEQKHEISQLITICNKYKQENEHLKGHLETYNKGCKELYGDKKRLEKELEQIKQNLKEAYENERTALGKSVLKQLIDGVIKQ